MSHLISFLFIIEFLLILNYFLITFFKTGFTFKGGIAAGVLYFIYIPIWVLILTGKLTVFKPDFGRTIVTNVVLKDEIITSLVLILYLFSILVYLYTPSIKLGRKPLNYDLNIKLKNVVFIYLITLIIILAGSGLLKGGDWYHNRNIFFKEGGSIAVLIAYIYNAAKILIIVAMFYAFQMEKLKLLRFLFLLFGFTLFDMFISGNRIYLFVTIVILALIVIKKHPIKSLIITPLITPIVLFFGYFGNIFRHMRGPLFANGLPTYDVFVYSLKRAIRIDPPRLDSFFLNMSESINVNVIYNIFDNYQETLFGATYLKTLLFYVPRSIWESKPESITVIAANTYGYSSLVTTIIGEMHMNFSYFGIILLPILLMFTESIITRFSKKNLFYGLLSFFFGMLIFRMPYSDEMLVFIFLVVIVYLTNKKMKLVFRK